MSKENDENDLVILIVQAIETIKRTYSNIDNSREMETFLPMNTFVLEQIELLIESYLLSNNRAMFDYLNLVRTGLVELNALMERHLQLLKENEKQ